MNYREALEFIGEVRAGISWERFCMKGVRHSDAFIDILNDGVDARNFLSSAGISREYIADQIRQIFSKLHLNRDNDHYLTLALSPNASEEQIHKRWKELMLLYHPDRNSDAEAAPCAARINDAYSILKSPEKRMEYDRSMRPSLDRYPLGREVGKFRIPPREHVFGSPRMRSILSKLLIPSCAIVAAVILLVMFHERRQALEQMKEKVEAEVKEQGKVQAKEEPKETAKAEVKVKELPKEEVKAKAEVKNEVRVKEETKPKAEVKVKVKEEVNAQGQTKEKAKAEVKIKEETKVKAEVKEQVKVKEEPKEKAKAEVKEQPKGKAEGKAEVKVKEETKPKAEVKVKVKEEVNAPGQTKEKTKAEVKGKAEEQTKEKTKVETESMEGAAAQFISRYARAYEDGDIDKFMSFFSSSVVENGKMNYEEIRKAYKKNFENSRYRYSLRNVKFRKNGDDVIVTASYLININRSAENADLVQGDIRWTLCREGEGLKITKVDYEGR